MDFSVKNTIKCLTLLELPDDKELTAEDIRSQYRKLCLVYHPDLANERYRDGTKFREISDAQDYLMKNLDGVNTQITSIFRSNNSSGTSNSNTDSAESHSTNNDYRYEYNYESSSTQTSQADHNSSDESNNTNHAFSDTVATPKSKKKVNVASIILCVLIIAILTIGIIFASYSYHNVQSLKELYGEDKYSKVIKNTNDYLLEKYGFFYNQANSIRQNAIENYYCTLIESLKNANKSSDIDEIANNLLYLWKNCDEYEDSKKYYDMCKYFLHCRDANDFLNAYYCDEVAADLVNNTYYLVSEFLASSSGKWATVDGLYTLTFTNNGLVCNLPGILPPEGSKFKDEGGIWSYYCYTDDDIKKAVVKAEEHETYRWDEYMLWEREKEVYSLLKRSIMNEIFDANKTDLIKVTVENSKVITVYCYDTNQTFLMTRT